MDAIRQAGISEFIFENRGGGWFCTEPWMRLFEEILQYAAECRMRVWLLDDSHVNTGSANDSLKRPENAPFRQQCLRIELMDVVGPVSAGAVFLPEHTAAETILAIAAYRRDEQSGECTGDPVDLSGNIKDGLCMLDLPEGIWRIYFVMTADPSRQGMFANYITMVSASSCRHLINEIHEKIYDRFSAYFGTVFAGFFSDEPAFGNCDGKYGDDYAGHKMGQLRRLYPWSADVARLLAVRCRMTEGELMLRLPALWDAVSPGDTALRLAYMDLITSLWRENYSCRLGDWCERHGVEYIGHVLEDEGAHMRTGWGCGHFFRAMAGQHMAGIDTVLGQTIPGITSMPHALNQGTRLKNTLFYQYTMPKLAVSLARHNPRMRGRSVCEIFGAYGWNAGLSFMRAILNFHLASGVNHYIPHAYSMCLPEVFRGDTGKRRSGGGFTPPGYCMSYLAPTFYAGGFNPQYGIFCKLMRYAQRVCHLLADGEHLTDTALYYNAEGDWVNQGVATSLDEVCAALTRSGFDYDILPADTLLHGAEVESSRLRIGKASYGALIVPGSTVLPEKLLERFEILAALGQTQEDYLPSEIEKFKDATGYEEFLDFDPAEVKAALDDPDKSHADEMLSAAERAASEKMTVLVVEPMKEPYVKEIDPDLHSLQAEVGGDIGATYPYSDPVALVCNDEGKLIGLDLNRGLRDENGEIYDIVAGTFLVVGLGEEDFASLSPELIQKYTEQFKTLEQFMQINGNIVVLPVPAEKQDLAYLPDRFETGERVQTPRGSFQVTAMSREQMEAAGYGVHHISDDGKYLIMGNGTRAFAVAAEQPEKDNPLRTAEMTLEDDYGMIDGVINNGRRGEESEKAQEYADRTTPEKPSIRERLEDAKRECAEHKPPEGKKSGRDVPEHDCL